MSDKLYFYSKSRDVYPGRGANEIVQDPVKYLPLSLIPRWRQVLSNFSDDCTIEYNCLTYRTIEHVFQAEKIGFVDPTAAREFALESGSALSLASGADAQKQRKMRKLNEAQLLAWKYQQTGLLSELWLYKVNHSVLFRNVLAATNDAQLWHIQNRKPAVRWDDLEAVRRTFTN